MPKALTKTFENHKIDLYLSGHEHFLQHLKPEGYTRQFISGTGSELAKLTEGVSYFRFQASEHGFLCFAIDANRLNVMAINIEGRDYTRPR